MSDTTNVIGDITEFQDEGVIKEILKESTSLEQPIKGDTVFVHYVGKLQNGQEFDSSIGRNEPFSFKLGNGQVIKGWDIGVSTMRIGEKCRLTIKPEYGYGSAGSGEKIPGDSTLVFEIELLSIKGEDVSEERDESVIKRIFVEGEGYAQPSDNTTVCVVDLSIEAVLCDSKTIPMKSESRIEWIIGQGDEKGIPEGLECAIMKMKKGEKAQVQLLKSRIHGVTVPDNTDKLIYTLTLESFEKGKESWEMDSNEKIESAKIQKDKGTKYFKNGQYKLAMKLYKRVVDLTRIESNSEESPKSEQLELFLQSSNNIVMCNIKLKDFRSAIEGADAILEKDSKNEKALFRRGESYLAINEWSDALNDFNSVLQLNPSNSAATIKIQQAKASMREYKEKEKNIFTRMMKGLVSKESVETAAKDSKCTKTCCESGEPKTCCKSGEPEERCESDKSKTCCEYDKSKTCCESDKSKTCCGSSEEKACCKGDMSQGNSCCSDQPKH